MTKEELAKKRGIKTTVKTQTAAESILTNKPTTPILNTSSDLVPVISNKEEKLEKNNNKAGRPKGKPHTKISLNVPNEYLELINIAAGINFKGNTSSYIVSLIKKDIDANGKIYEQIRAMKTIGSI